MLEFYAFTISCIIIELNICVFLPYGTFLKAFRILVDALKLLNRLSSNICESAKNTSYILDTKFSDVEKHIFPFEGKYFFKWFAVYVFKSGL